MADSIFTKIIRGEVPCHKIYEDNRTFAFLDIHPKQPGHVLVVPKKEVDHVWDLPNADYIALMETSKRVANKIRKVMKPSRVAMQIEGTGVPHAHVHIFPFATVQEFHTEGRMDKPADDNYLAELAKKLAF